MDTEHILSRMAAFDRNGNDLIDADEAASEAERVFLFVDIDDDGDLSETEFMDVNMGIQETLLHTGPRRERQQEKKLPVTS